MNTNILNLHPTSELISSDSWFFYLLDTRDGQKRDFIKGGQTSTSANEQDAEGNRLESSKDWVQKLIQSGQSIFSLNISYKNVVDASIFRVVHGLRQYRDAEIVVGVAHFSRRQMSKICKAHGFENLDDLLRSKLNQYGFYSNKGGTDREEIVGASMLNIEEVLKCVKQIYEALTATKTAGKEEFKLKFLQAEIDVMIDGHLREHQRCLIQATGGFGKSTMSLRIACSDFVMSRPGCTLVLTPVKATGSDFQSNAKKFQYFGREAVVVLLAEINERKFFELLTKCKTDGNMLVVIATVQDVRGKLKLKDEDGDSAEDAEAVVKELLKLETKYKFLIGNIRLLIRDEIHLQYAAETTYNALSGLKPDLTVDMTATLTAREAVLFGYGDGTIASCSLMRVLKAKKDRVKDVQGLPDIGLIAAKSMNLPREILDELGVTSEAEITAAKLFAIEDGKFKTKNAVLKLLERTFSLGQKFGALEGTKAMWGPALCGKEPLSTGVYMLVVPRGDSSFSASKKCRLVVELGAAYDEDALFITGEDLEHDANLNDRPLELSVRRLQLKNPGRKIIIVTHRKLLTGVNIPQLEGIALWDSIESQALFLQLWYRLFREYDYGKSSHKKTAHMVVYEPGVSIGDTSVAHAVGQLFEDELDDLDSESKKRRIRELEGLIGLQMYAEAGQKKISTEELFSAYEASYAAKMAEQFGGTVRTDTIRTMLGDSYAELLGLVQAIKAKKDGTGSKNSITEDNGGKTNKPGSKGSSDETEEDPPARDDDAIQTLQALLQQLPWLAHECGEYNLEKLLTHPFVTALFRKNGGAVLEMIQSSSALREFLTNRLKYTKVDSTKSVTIGRGETAIVLDGGIVLELLAKLPSKAERVLLVNPKRFLLEEARKKWPSAKIVILTYEEDPYLGLYKREGLTVISVEKNLLCGTIEDMKLKFNVVVGNPPYQSDDAKATSGGTNRKLWPLFLAQAFQNLEEDGHLGFVIPNTWCAGAKNPLDSTNIFKDYIKKKNLMWLETEVAQRCFPGIGIGISAFVLQNTDVHPNSVEVNGQKIKNFQSWDFIPKIGDMVSIFDKTMDYEAFDFEMVRAGVKESETSEVKTREFKFKTYVGTKGFRYIPFDTKYRTDRKVIIHRMTSLIPIVDELGEISPTYSQVYRLRDGEIGENFVSLMKTKFYRALNEGARYTQYTESRTLNAFPKVDLSRTWTDEQLYEYFKLTQAEIDLIEQTIK